MRILTEKETEAVILDLYQQEIESSVIQLEREFFLVREYRPPAYLFYVKDPSKFKEEFRMSVELSIISRCDVETVWTFWYQHQSLLSTFVKLRNPVVCIVRMTKTIGEQVSNELEQRLSNYLKS